MSLWQYQSRSEPIQFETPPPDGWQGSAEPPVSNWRKAALYAVAAVAPFFFTDADSLTRPETVSVDRWYAQDIDFARAEKRQPHLAPAAFFDERPVADPSLLDWYRPLSEPVRKYASRRHLGQWTLDDSQLLTQPETVSVDRWYTQDIDFARKAKRRPHLAPAVFFNETPVAPPSDLGHLGWHQPLSEPLRTRPPLPTAAQQALAIDPDALTRPEETTPDRWGGLWPDRIDRERRAPERTPFLFADPAPVAAPVDLGHLGWHSPLSEPVRTSAPRGHLWPPSFDDPFLLAQPEATTIDRWFQPFSLPLPPRVIPTAAQLAAFYVGEPIIPPAAPPRRLMPLMGVGP